MPPSTPHDRGFTLFGLAIVLVVLGLIAGSIFAGNSLIHAAQLRSVMNDLAAYSNAVGTFKAKYKALPGDMANANDYWPAASDNCAAQLSLPRIDTCNGDGNTFIDAETVETFLAWQHLSNAHMLDVAYTGAPSGSSAADAQPGLNVPAARLNGSGLLLTSGLLTSDSLYSTFLFLGNVSSYRIGTNSPVLTSEDALNIDTKMDDGLPGYGSVRGMDNILVNSPQCATTSDPATAKYQSIYANNPSCVLLFKTGL